MDFYSIRHLTNSIIRNPVSESLMEARMHPRSDNNQRCLIVSLSVSPRCRVFSYRDHLGNNVHHFDIPGEHSQLVMVAEALVEQQPLPEIPQSLCPGHGTSWIRWSRWGIFRRCCCRASLPSHRPRCSIWRN